MDFSSLLLMLHSINRWIIVLVTLIALVKFALGYFKKEEFTRRDGRIISLWVGLLDLQLMFGLVILLSQPITRPRLEHAIPLILAVTFAHIYKQWNAAESTVKFRNNALLVGGIALIIVAAVAALPQGWLGHAS